MRNFQNKMASFVILFREPFTTADSTANASTANVCTADVTTADVLVLGYGLWVRVLVRVWIRV